MVDDVEPEAFDAVAAAVDAAMAGASSGDGGGMMARFERLRVADLQLRYDDAISGEVWT